MQASDRRQSAIDGVNEHRLAELDAVKDVEEKHAAGWAGYADQLQASHKETRASDKAVVKRLVTAIFKRVLQHEAQELQVT